MRTERAGSASSHLAWGALTVLLLTLSVGWLFVDVRRAKPVRPADRSTEESAGHQGPAAGPDKMFVNQIDPRAAEGTGIHLLPGSKSKRGGILVPEGYELPPGYMRHYQTTDDGEPVGAILVFHPDYRPVDSNGQPIALPADRVVPPELAPEGMPIQTLELSPVRPDLDETSEPP